VFGVMMAISVSLVGTVKLIYSRADMDLLLSSPVPPYSVVLVRVLAVALGIFCIAAVVTLPFANVLTVAGYPRFLAVYAVVISLVLLATSMGVLMAQGMFRLFGPRRTRVFAQIFAGVFSLGFVFIVNARNILPESAKNALMEFVTNLAGQAPGPDSWLWMPARAMLGEPLPLLVGVLFCVGLFLATTLGLANSLIANAVAANGTAGKTVRSSRSLSSRGGPIAVLRRKEWVLIGRDPWLISQIMMQLLMMVPAMFVIAKMGAAQLYTWVAVVFLTGQLAAALAWLTMSTEEAPDLLATAPVRRRDVLWAKLQAALIPTAMLAGIPIGVAFWISPWLGFTLMLCSAGAALTNALLHLLNPKPAKRSDLSRRGGNVMLSVCELLFNLMWLIFGVLMLALGWWGMLALLILVPFAWQVWRRVRA
jgi:ABC-2 type transport system permease protein